MTSRGHNGERRQQPPLPKQVKSSLGFLVSNSWHSNTRKLECIHGRLLFASKTALCSPTHTATISISLAIHHILPCHPSHHTSAVTPCFRNDMALRTSQLENHDIYIPPLSVPYPRTRTFRAVPGSPCPRVCVRVRSPSRYVMRMTGDMHDWLHVLDRGHRSPSRRAQP